MQHRLIWAVSRVIVVQIMINNLWLITGRLLATGCLFAGLWGCARTQITTHAAGLKPPFCKAQAEQSTALVLWGAAWRENQKEGPLREEIASSAISQFFSTGKCYSKVNVLKSLADRDPVILSDTEALKFAATLPERYGKVIILRLEELGPLVLIYPSPILWEGGTEVVLRVRMLDVNSSALEADLALHWKNSGPFVLKGTKTLQHDLQTALASVFLSGQSAGK